MVDKTIDDEFPGDTLKKSDARLLTTDPNSGDDSVGKVGEIDLQENFPAHSIKVDDSTITEAANAFEIIKKTGQDTGLERLKINSKGGFIQKATNVTTEFSSIFDVIAELMTYSFIGSSYFYGSHSAGLSIFDVTNPTVPEFIQQINIMFTPTPTKFSVANTSCIKRHGSFVYATYLGDATAGAIGEAALTFEGVGYTSIPTATVTGGSGSGAEVVVILNPDGTVGQLVLTKRGAGYDGFQTLVFSGGSPSSPATGTASTITAPAGLLTYDTNDIAIPPTEVVSILDSVPLVTGPVPSLEEVHRFVISGNFGYFADKANSTITVMDFTNPLKPTTAVLLTAGGGFEIDEPVAITVYGNYLIWSNTGTTKSIVVASINSPTATPIAPEEITSIASVGGDLDFVGDIVVQGNHIYCAPGLAGVETTTDQFTILDIHEVTNPTRISNTTVSGGSGQMHIHGDYAVIVGSLTSGNILEILDISDPTTPVPLFTIADRVEDAAASSYFLGNFLYLGTKSAGEDAKLNVLNLQGHFTQGINAGIIDTSQLQVTKHAHIQTLDVQSMLHVGEGGVHSDGKLTSARGSAVTPKTQTVAINSSSNTDLDVDFTDDESVILLSQGSSGTITLLPLNVIPGHKVIVNFTDGGGGTGVPVLGSAYVISQAGKATVASLSNTVIELTALSLGGGTNSILAVLNEET